MAEAKTGRWKAIWKQVIYTIPAVTLMWLQMALVMAIDRNMAIISFVPPVYFIMNRARKFRLRMFVKDYLLLVSLMILGNFVTWHIALQVVADLIIGFCIVFALCNRASQYGYLSYFMAFVFIQFRPIPFSKTGLLFGLVSLMFALDLVWFGVAILYRRRHHISIIYHQKEMGVAAAYLEILAKDPYSVREETPEAVELKKVIDAVYSAFYDSRRFPSTISYRSLVLYKIAIFLKRMYHLPNLVGREILVEERESLEGLAAMLRHGQQNIIHGDADALIMEVVNLQRPDETTFDRYYNTSLEQWARILHDICFYQKSQEKTLITGFQASGDYIRRFGLGSYLLLNEYRVRFALRLSSVLAFTALVAYFIPDQYSYWLPLNAIFMVHPIYEQSITQMNGRIMGTLVGSLLALFLFHAFPYSWMHLVGFAAGSFLFYAWSPAKWSRNIWTAVYATSLVSLSMGVDSTVITRVAYILTASVVSTVFNRFVFSMNDRSQYINTLQSLAHLSSQLLERLTVKELHDVELGAIIYSSGQLHYMQNIMAGYLKRTTSDLEAGRNLRLGEQFLRLHDKLLRIYYVLISNEAYEEYRDTLCKIRDCIQGGIDRHPEMVRSADFEEVEVLVEDLERELQVEFGGVPSLMGRKIEEVEV